MATLCTNQSAGISNFSADTESRVHSAAHRNGITVIRDMFGKIARRIEIRRQQKIDRDAFRQMLSLNDELLDDIGVTRDAVRWAAQLPLEEDAAVVLRETVQGGSRVAYR